MSSPNAAHSPRWLGPTLLGGAVVLAVVAAFVAVNAVGPKVQAKSLENITQEEKREKAPEFPAKMEWLNTAGPVKLADLKGKVVILDFWTLCCINCIHILPDLAALEKKYPNELVVIGVHSAKFENEKDTKSIRKAILRYEIAHPVVNDADHKIWNEYGVNSWPTFGVIDADGKFVGTTSGEGQLELLDKVVAKLIAEAKEKKTLNATPVRFDLIRYRETADTPLFFPGKVLADEPGDRLFIADSTHHRVVVTDLAGKFVAAIGSGSPGYKNGRFADTQFDDPQGMVLDGDTLYIADRKNHSVRAADLKAGTVRTVAGTGKQDSGTRAQDTPGDPLKLGLNSPWDLLKVGNVMYIAMAGHHQIWQFDLKANTIQVFSGNGRENIKDGPHYAANFAQPSGLATDGTSLYVADSEVSAIRKVPINPEGRVETLVGEGLFEFGDVDGQGPKARLQHALGVVYHDGKLIVADTYNSKLKTLDPKTAELKTLLGGDAKATEPLFNEPAGLSVAAGKLYVADTNAHRIRVVDLKTNAVSTLELSGVKPPPPQSEWLPPAEKKDK